MRFDVDLNLKGSGPYELVLSHPVASGTSKPFTAFRGSLQIRSEEGLQEVHVGMRSGQSLSLAQLNLRAGQLNPVRISLVYPADATPGHLLSILPASQLAIFQARERQIELARNAAGSTPAPAPISPPELTESDGLLMAPIEFRPMAPLTPVPPLIPPLTPPPSYRGSQPSPMSQSLYDRYQQALEAQQQMLRGLMGR